MSAPNLNVAARAIALLAFCMAIAACAPSSDKAASVTPAIKAGARSADATAQAAESAARAPSPLAAKPSAPDSATEQNGAAERSEASVVPSGAESARALPFADRLLAEKPFGARMPADFVLGPLSPSSSALGVDRAARDLVRDLVAGKADPSRFESDYAPVFEALYRDALAALPPELAWRLARGSDGPDGARVYAFALVSAQTRAEGSLRLYQADGSWLLASLDLDLEQLSRPRSERASDFDPDRFDWPE